MRRCPLWVKSRHVQCTNAMSALPPIATAKAECDGWIGEASPRSAPRDGAHAIKLRQNQRSLNCNTAPLRWPFTNALPAFPLAENVLRYLRAGVVHGPAKHVRVCAGRDDEDRVGVSFYKKYQAATFSHPQFVGMYTVGFSYCIDAEMSFRFGLLRLARSFRFGLSHLAWVLCHLGSLFHV